MTNKYITKSIITSLILLYSMYIVLYPIYIMRKIRRCRYYPASSYLREETAMKYGVNPLDLKAFTSLSIMAVYGLESP